jgi:predicted ferric reductase
MLVPDLVTEAEHKTPDDASGRSLRRHNAMHIRPFQAVAAVAAVGMILTLAEIPRADWLTLSALSMCAGVAAMSLMASAALLGGRLRLVESMFGGLDRVYLAHKWLAVTALVLASVHFAFKAGLPDWNMASIMVWPSFATRLVRQTSFLALMLIVMLALNRKIPYSKWRWWHKLSGPLFAIVVLHWLTIKSPVALASAAGIWLAVLSALGLGAAAYKLFLYPLLSKHARYRVIATEPDPTGLHMELEPARGRIEFKPGQFGFLSMKEDGLREPHPFTIASGGADGRVHFVIRNLGDYTERLVREVRPGMHAEIYAPFGRFHRPENAAQEAWIAGGVGITPFIAWLTQEPCDASRATLFYLYTPGREFPKAERLEALARSRGADFLAVRGGPASEEFRQRFGELVRRGGPDGLVVSFCGPAGLLAAVRKLMREHNVPESNLRYEHFEFR